MKKLLFLIPTTGKTAEQITAEAWAAYVASKSNDNAFQKHMARRCEEQVEASLRINTEQYFKKTNEN